ncbi:MAG: hypothetical protein COB04_18715 [Gammaproteobacteria bacterium]|nr:MAG: hypothetical protein COB04_18715 [Gammaproteobacteria bacterium]
MNGKVIIIGLIAGAIGVFWLSRRLDDAGDAINPVSQDNIFYQGINAVVEKLMDPLGETEEEETLGAVIYDGVEWVRSIGNE